MSAICFCLSAELREIEELLAERGGFEPPILDHYLRLLESVGYEAESMTCKTPFPATLDYDNLRQPLLPRF